jgi:hypothetical protein
VDTTNDFKILFKMDNGIDIRYNDADDQVLVYISINSSVRLSVGPILAGN